MVSEAILLVDDEPGVLEGQKSLLELEGYKDIIVASDHEAAVATLEANDIGLAIVDLNLNGRSGHELIGWIKSNAPHVTVIVVTAASDAASAVQAMKAGASDFIVKGAETDRFLTSVQNAMNERSARLEARVIRDAFLRDQLQRPELFSDFITRSERIYRIFLYLEAVAPLSDPILLTGETGVGKEVIAKAVHMASGSSGEFVAVNFGGLDDHTISDTLFGHTKGAFTGAHSPRDGLIKAATGGTLFVDEFAEISPESQVKLLRLLDSGEYYPLGSDRLHHARTRFLFATNQNLEYQIERGGFRRDLYFRISAHHIQIPALRDRPEDIEPILAFHLESEASRVARTPPALNRNVMDSIRALQLHGNVRELQRIALKAILTNSWDHVPQKDDSAGGLPPGPLTVGEPEPGDQSVVFGATLPPPGRLLNDLLREADRRHPNNRTAAAASIGLSPQAFANRWRRMERSGDGHK